MTLRYNETIARELDSNQWCDLGEMPLKETVEGLTVKGKKVRVRTPGMITIKRPTKGSRFHRVLCKDIDTNTAAYNTRVVAWRPLNGGTEPTEQAPKKFITDLPRRQPTRKEERIIYAELEEFFDEMHGQYVKGQSDQTLADRIGVPAIMVADLREEAFGPIKSSPEIEAFKQEMQSFARQLDSTMETMCRLEQKKAELFKRLDALGGSETVASNGAG